MSRAGPTWDAQLLGVLDVVATLQADQYSECSLHLPAKLVFRQTQEGVAAYLNRPLLPDEVPSHTQGVLVDSNDLTGCQDLRCAPAESAQVCPNEQWGLEQAPKGKMAPLLILQQSRIANLCQPV